jgi:hypothetical protein
VHSVWPPDEGRRAWPKSYIPGHAGSGRCDIADVYSPGWCGHGDVTLGGLDLHDGTALQAGNTVYLYGTRYGCGFTWGHNGTPWCGFGMSSAASIAGPWATPKLLFSPTTKIEATGWRADNGKTWTQMCGISGAGCFNPRMVESPRGIWLLWFNSPGDKGRHANPYWVLSCAGPSGPCRNPHKPAIYGCNTGGDFSISVEGATGFLVCAGASRIIGIEQLAAGDENGLNIFHGNISLGAAEGVGIFHTSAGQYEATFSSPNCGYCSGTKAAASGAVRVQTGYATAASLSRPWHYDGILPGGYCTGQPRTAFEITSGAYEWVDEWDGSPNETTAPILLVPMAMTPWSCNIAGGK